MTVEPARRNDGGSAVQCDALGANRGHDASQCFIVQPHEQEAGSRRRRAARLSLVLAGLLGIATSCGRPASTEQCEDIVERVTVLELKQAKIESPEQVKQHVAETKERFHSAMQEHCVGKRITQSALDCIDEASSTDQVFEDCLD